MGFSQKAEQLLELPIGALSKEARIEIEGQRQVTVAGPCEICEYEESLVRLKTRSGEVRVNGHVLVLETFCAGGACVTGAIASVEFL